MWKFFSALLTIGVLINIWALLSEFSMWRLVLLIFNVAVCIGAFVQAVKERSFNKQV